MCVRLRSLDVEVACQNKIDRPLQMAGLLKRTGLLEHFLWGKTTAQTQEGMCILFPVGGINNTQDGRRRRSIVK